jgi:peptide deformylase
MKSVIILLVFILLCIPNSFFVTALQILEPKFDARRKFLLKTIVSVSGVGIPAKVVDASTTTISHPLLSIESAAACLGVGRSSDNDSIDYDNNNEQQQQQPLLLKVRLYPDPSLRRIASPVTKEFGNPELETVVNYLINNMKSNGTAAIQYGIDARIIILKGNAASPNSSVNVYVNPNILSRSNEYSMIPWREYCSVVMESENVAVENNNNNPSSSSSSSSSSLNTTTTSVVPAVVEVDLLRDDIIEIAAQDYITGRPIRKALRGESARAFQHELDHLNGLLIIDHAADILLLPTYIANLERPYHTERQRRAFQRNTFQGNTPLYY